LDDVPTQNSAPLQATNAYDSQNDSLVRSSSHNDLSAWLRLPVSVVVSGFLFVFLNVAVGIAWLCAVMIAEAFAWLTHKRIETSGKRWRLPALVSLWVISLCWVAFGVLLWSTDNLVAQNAAIVGLLTAAVYGITSSYMNPWALLALSAPQLLALLTILISYAWTKQEPLAAMVTTLASVGACAVVALNGATLHKTDRNLTKSNTDLIDSNRRIKALARQAHARSEARRELLTNVSHELRSPLNGVIASAHQLAASVQGDDQKRLVQIILSSGETLDRLAGDLLDLSAIESGQSSVRPTIVELGQLVESIADQHRNLIEARGLTFKVDIAQTLDKPVLLDAVRLQQVLGNLLTNAAKYTREGAIRLTFRTVIREDLSEWAEILVEDTGPGLTAVDAETIFARFNRGADGSPSQPGLGIGLTIARTLAQSMGGQLSVEPRKIGSAFALTLPLTFATVDGQPDQAPAGGLKEGAALTATGLSVLIADDHEQNRHILTVILEALGAKVSAVPDGTIAVREFSVHPFDLVILDMIMPGKDGLAATREMRMVEEMARSGRTPILLLTAMHTQAAEAAGAEAGADLMLTKPITPALLADAISRFVAAPSAAAPAA
jgi:signal transduction histidine kinase/ActR/RegA family two-component response regulator